MREYKTTETRILTRMICNSCGKVIALRGGVPDGGRLRRAAKLGLSVGKRRRTGQL